MLYTHQHPHHRRQTHLTSERVLTGWREGCTQPAKNHHRPSKRRREQETTQEEKRETSVCCLLTLPDTHPPPMTPTEKRPKHGAVHPSIHPSIHRSGELLGCDSNTSLSSCLIGNGRTSLPLPLVDALHIITALAISDIIARLVYCSVVVRVHPGSERLICSNKGRTLRCRCSVRGIPRGLRRCQNVRLTHRRCAAFLFAACGFLP
mmetsp:Transcript_11947/g.34633  ORF Transcript_11947/g.34633 Transcript_11947/m.34633 type:complete len:206 (-) Transcript_11947:517-1134(-)